MEEEDRDGGPMGRISVRVHGRNDLWERCLKLGLVKAGPEKPVIKTYFSSPVPPV